MKLYIGRNAYNTRDQTLDYYGEADTSKELIELENQYLKEINFKSYYYNWIFDKDKNGNPMIIQDFGSWSRFFYVYDLSGELLEDWNKMSKGNLE